MKYLILILTILSTGAYADLINPKDKEEFYGNSESLMNEKVVKPLNKALVNKGECLKFKKNGEYFWNKYETEIIKVQEIGSKTLKVQRIIFVNKKSDKWMDTESYAMPFEFQMNYDVFPCPKDEDKLSDKEVAKIKEALKK